MLLHFVKNHFTLHMFCRIGADSSIRRNSAEFADRGWCMLNLQFKHNTDLIVIRISGTKERMVVVGLLVDLCDFWARLNKR